mmetsp:Transcript_39479/g.118520  ORF Transcript_39479/g.118520 Transcript_39479/m.118520 type:complete len:92 (+) Transcript_39479:375-650(+)
MNESSDRIEIHGDGNARKRSLENMSSEFEDEEEEEQGSLDIETSDDVAMAMPTGETTEETAPLELTFESSLPSDVRLRVASYLRPSDLYGV